MNNDSIKKAEWLTVREACDLLQVTRPTLSAYIRAGKIKSTKIIGKVYISYQSISDTLNSVTM